MSARGRSSGLPTRMSALAVAILYVSVVMGCTSDATESKPKPTKTQAANVVVPWKRIMTGYTQRNPPPFVDASIALELIADGPAVQGQPYEFIVRIRKTGATPAPLEPCPAYRMQYIKKVQGGFLNCDAAPDAIPAGKYVDFQMTFDVRDYAPPEIAGSYDLLWQLGDESNEGKFVQLKVRMHSGSTPSSVDLGRVVRCSTVPVLPRNEEIDTTIDAEGKALRMEVGLSDSGGSNAYVIDYEGDSSCRERPDIMRMIRHALDATS